MVLVVLGLEHFEPIREVVDGHKVLDSVYEFRPKNILNHDIKSRKRYENGKRELAQLLAPKKSSLRSSRLRLALLASKTTKGVLFGADHHERPRQASRLLGHHQTS